MPDPLDGRARIISTKRQRYEQLVAARKKCELCAGLTNPAIVQSGDLDSSQLGPYSRWHSDLDADLVVVAKDFAPVQRFVEYGGKPGKRVPTNTRLIRSLATVGFEAGAVAAQARSEGLFFTNAILCLPPGEKMRTASFHKAARTCGRRFLRPLVDLIGPRAIVSLGEQATLAVLGAYGEVGSFAQALELDKGLCLPEGPRLFAVPHPVASRTTDEHLMAWNRVRRHLAAV